MIKPKFAAFTTAEKLDAIMAVMEADNGNYRDYYLTKKGRELGLDSLYVYDKHLIVKMKGTSGLKTQKPN